MNYVYSPYYGSLWNHLWALPTASLLLGFILDFCSPLLITLLSLQITILLYDNLMVALLLVIEPMHLLIHAATFLLPCLFVQVAVLGLEYTQNWVFCIFFCKHPLYEWKIILHKHRQCRMKLDMFSPPKKPLVHLLQRGSSFISSSFC